MFDQFEVLINVIKISSIMNTAENFIVENFTL